MGISCSFCDYSDFSEQVLLESESTYVIYPRKPVFKYHLIFFPKEHKSQFIELSESELINMQTLIKAVIGKFSDSNDNFIGYNLFSNNGDERVGQSVPHYHCHMFLRRSDEEASPYRLMNDPELRHNQDVSLRNKNFIELKKILNA